MIWLVGNKGMLGSEVERLLKADGLGFAATDLGLDITNQAAVSNLAKKLEPKWIVNCAAYTTVEKAEDEYKAALAVNAAGPENLARAALEQDAKLIHISTDYVFDGEKGSDYLEDDTVNPKSAYGKSKELGEKNVRLATPRHFILRTAWLYGRNGGNFVATMLKLFAEKDEVRVVNDQFGSPTYAPDLAQAIVKIVNNDSEKFGTYHFTNEGRISWFDFACEIYRLAKAHGLVKREVRIVPISTAEYPTKVPRPANTYLSKEKIKRDLGISIRDWKIALDEFLKAVSLRVPSLSRDEAISRLKYA
jgi:dTDP-4-dehydrorhamnose reductase